MGGAGEEFRRRRRGFGAGYESWRGEVGIGRYAKDEVPRLRKDTKF